MRARIGLLSIRKGKRVMKFAHFSHVWGKAGMTPSERYQQLWRELELCDELGYDYGFAVEHHFRPDESWMTAPNFYAIAAGARTRRIRLGAMGHIVPLHDPVRLVEEIALTDQMLDGRIDVGLVPGIVSSLAVPYLVLRMLRPEIERTPAAPEYCWSQSAHLRLKGPSEASIPCSTTWLTYSSSFPARKVWVKGTRGGIRRSRQNWTHRSCLIDWQLTTLIIGLPGGPKRAL